MFRILIILGLGLMLSGCLTDNNGIPIVQDKYTVVAPPDSMYRCDQLASLPNVATLTDLQVARLIVKLDENNRICGKSMKTLKQFYVNAKKRFG